MERIKLRVFASLSEDINNGWIWLPEGIINERIVIRLKNVNSGKTVYCEAIAMGVNYLARYNENKNTVKIYDYQKAIVMNEWYRKKLSIPSTQIDIEFDVTKKDNLWGYLRASLHHPQIVVRLAMGLAIFSFILSILGIFL